MDQHGTPEEEDDVGNIITSMEEAVELEWRRRRRRIAVVVGSHALEKQHSQQWWTLMHKERERRGREKTSSTNIHKA